MCHPQNLESTTIVGIYYIQILKQAIKASDKSQLILDYFVAGTCYKSSEIADFICLSTARTRVYLKYLIEKGKLFSKGSNKNKVYYISEQAIKNRL